ncbi:MAG: NAD(P)-dependent oxidoreductase [Desulfobacterales bacterium]|nr:NAD(P)-dependent oxidoreductase [Desulfobacterales bacterium]
MHNSKTIACVTGASGMVGSKIVQRLRLQGYKVRALSRSKHFDDANVELFRGGLEDEEVLKSFLSNAHLLFHCAAELYDESKMLNVNVLGTERLLRLIKDSSIEYLCYLSSAGVVGRTHAKWVNEETICKPQNAYEQSKWAAEQLVADGIDGCRIVILRPTNVVDEKRPGALALPIHGSFLNRLKVFIKGGECAHIVHAEDVAEAALHFIYHPFDSPQCYFVSCDYEPLNTFAELWALYRAVENNYPVDNLRPVLHLPLIVPHTLRKLWRGRGNRGDVRYSSEKLISEGFKFPFGVKGTVKQIIKSADFRQQ